ncbi:hypothetical protein [Frondihabitans australicus]|uniref:Uncharacterized protein n=1 Tax=Frondihabitans australicus TaxID=386892 RepID=A0A495IMB3_9MICO|nr:hypothetical protein [Frondihabitans australicus]RKR76306.1 hypothetical protein C8E83_3475 [Frondihabitans australicus]
MTDSPDPIMLNIDQTEGVYLVTTMNGSAYVIDFDKMTARRTPNPDDDDDEKNLRKDGEERSLLGMSRVAIGADMVMILDIRGDGIPTRRWTSMVIRIERLQ